MKRSFIGERGVKKRQTATPIVSQSTYVHHTQTRYTIEEALDIFTQAKEAEGLRPRSIENYREHTKYLMRYINRSPFYIDELKPGLIREYLLYLKQDRITYEEIESRATKSKGLSPYTINLRLRSLKTMCAFWEKEEMITKNPTINIKRVKSDHIDEVPGLSDVEIKRILNYFDERQFAQWQEVAYNSHYGTVGFHPLVAFDGVTGDFLKAKLRPGNVYTSNGVVEFIQPIIEHYNEKFPATSLFVRGDSGFAVPALYDLCEKESVYFVIRLKSNAALQRIAEELHPSSTPFDVAKTECYFEETIYQAKSWSKPRKVIVKSIRPAGELFFIHSFFVTNLVDAFSPKDIVLAYQKRGTMENCIKEAKNGFNFDKMNSHAFQVNEVKMMLSLLAYNLTNWLRTLSFPKEQKNMQIETIRTRILKVASKLVKSGRSLYFKLSSSFVYQEFFWKVLSRIQNLQIE